MTAAIIYGATGYSGARIARYAASLGLRPTLAGRSAQALQALGTELNLPWLEAQLEDSASLVRALDSFDVLLNCAGPFAATYSPMIEACLATKTDYLDITGEVDVYEGLAERDAAAAEAGIMVMPGVGFDMVPGDCLALWLKERLADATELAMAYSIRGTVSRGTLMSMPASNEILVRRDHELVRLESPHSKAFPFETTTEAPEVECYPLSFGDVCLAWRATGIGNITSYIHLTPEFQQLAELAASGAINALPVGPDEQELKTGKAFVTGEVRNAAGDTLRATITLPQIYQATFISAAHILKDVLAGHRRNGYTTPAQLLGAEYALSLPGFSLRQR